MASLMLFCALSPISRLSIMASVLILAVIAVRLLCRRLIPRNVMFVLWIVVIARLLIPFTLTTPVSIFNVYEPFGIRYDGDFPYRDVKLELYADGNEADGTVGGKDSGTEHKDELRNEALIRHPIAIMLRVGVPLLLSSVLISYVLTSRRLKNMERVEDERVLRIIRTMKHHERVSIVSIAGNDTIMIFGILRPTVILPEDYRDIGDVSLRYLLMHEMEHYYHGDGAWNILMHVACFIHWFNPLVWIARRLFLNDMETACDERVLRHLNEDEKKTFAETLVDFASRSVRKKPLTVMAFGKTNVRDRVRRIVRHKRLPRAVGIMSGVIILAVSLTFATGAVNVFDGEDFVYDEWVSIDEYTMSEDGELLKIINLTEDVHKLTGLPSNSYLRHTKRWFTSRGESSLMINRSAPLPICVMDVRRIVVTKNGESVEITDSAVIDELASLIKSNENGKVERGFKERYELRVYFDVECSLVWNLTLVETDSGRLLVDYRDKDEVRTVDLTELLRSYINN